jgi:hypothetical protein
VYDHFATEYEYADGRRVQSQARQIENCADNVSEWAIGTKGIADCNGTIKTADSEWKYSGKRNNSYEQEHVDLINSIQEGKPLNEGRTSGESTLMAIMGRESAYAGQTVTREQVLNSKQSFILEKYDVNASLPKWEVAIPGKYKLI